MPEEKTMLPVMMGIKEIHEKTGLSDQFIRTLCKEGKVKYIRSGWKYLINSESLNTYLNTGDCND